MDHWSAICLSGPFPLGTAVPWRSKAHAWLGFTASSAAKRTRPICGGNWNSAPASPINLRKASMRAPPSKAVGR